MWLLSKWRQAMPRVGNPVHHTRAMIEAFCTPGRDALADCLLATRGKEPPDWDAGIYVSTSQSTGFYADIFEFWVRALHCFVEDTQLGSLFHSVVPDLLCQEMPPSIFRDRCLSLLHARKADAAFIERQSFPQTRIELEDRRFDSAWLIIDRPDFRSAVAQTEGEFLAFFVTMAG
ncbi:MAG: hypothetical protein WD715_07080 [Dongiaceae bacterium]